MIYAVLAAIAISLFALVRTFKKQPTQVIQTEITEEELQKISEAITNNIETIGVERILIKNFELTVENGELSINPKK